MTFGVRTLRQLEKKAVKVGKAIQRQANGARRAASRTLKKARLPPAVKEAAKQAVEGPIRDFHEVEHLVGRAQGADILKGFRRSVQFDDYSCGVQCTQAILDYFDVQVSASVLEKELGTTRRGTDEDQIRSVLRKNGLRSRSFDSATMRRLRNAIAAGSPVLVSVDSGKHWSVVYGYGKGTVYLADPSFAVFATLTEERFLERWDGGGVVVFR